jgi:hypothetical protein
LNPKSDSELLHLIVRQWDTARLSQQFPKFVSSPRAAPIEGNSRSSAQLHQLMTFLLDHLDVSSIASKLVTLLEPNRFDEAFDAEGKQVTVNIPDA